MKIRDFEWKYKKKFNAHSLAFTENACVVCVDIKKK